MLAFIINYNRITLTRNMADWCANHDLVPVIIDNASDYEPLLKYYKTCPYKVVRLNRNYGHTVLWDSVVLNLFDLKEGYILTDPDLEMNNCSCDFLDLMKIGLKRYPNVAKCGFSLEVNDLPTQLADNIKKYEMRWWAKPLDEQFFAASIDTTFALYRPGVVKYTRSGIRTNRPYTIRHIPWYYTDFSILPEDEQYYIKTANNSFSSKNRLGKR